MPNLSLPEQRESGTGTSLQRVSSVEHAGPGGIGTADLADNAVTLAKIVAAAADGFLANDSGGAADWQELSVAEANTLLNVATQTAPGTLEVATTAEVNTGTDDVRALSPLALAGSAPAILGTNVTAIPAANLLTGAIEVASKRIQHSDLTAAATNESIDFDAALPANALILGCYIDIATLFSGGAVSDLDVDVGISGGDTDKQIVDLPAFTGDPTGEIYVGATVGAAFSAADSNNAKALETSAATIAVDTKAVGANVSVLDAGDMTIFVFYVVVS